MNFLRSIISWIDSFEAGSQFRKWATILLKIVGVLVFIASIVWGISILAGSIAIGSDWGRGPQVIPIIGAVLGICINIIVGIVLMMLFWNRAKKVKDLGEESHFTLIPIAVILVRMVGEVGFLTFAVAGIQVFIFSIFGSGISRILASITYDLGIVGDYRFIAGVISLVISVLGGAIVLIFYYFLAELINLFVDMATNLKKIEASVSTEEVVSETVEEADSDA